MNLSPVVFLLTAKDLQSLKSLAAKYINFLQTTNYRLLDVCYSLLFYQPVLKYKLIISCNSKEELCCLLKKFTKNDNKLITSNQIYLEDDQNLNPKIAYVFSGQGGQWFAMGKNLIANDTIFKTSIKEIDILFKKIAGWSLMEEMNKEKDKSLINKTEVVQPAIFAIQVSLVKLLEYYGVIPQAVVGHSLGEIAAAYVSGCISLKKAVYIVYHSSRIQAKQANTGKLLAVQIGIDEAKKYIKVYKNRISIATINGPDILTISGDTELLKYLAKFFTKKGYFNRFVNAEVPYHSHYMDILKPELINCLSNIIVKPTILPLYSTVSTKQENGLHLTGSYWFKNIRYPVLFNDTINTMTKDGFNLFIEIGPHPLLVKGMYSLFKINSYKGIAFSLMNRKFENETNYFKQGLVRLIVNNVNVDIKKLLKSKGNYIPLPY